MTLNVERLERADLSEASFSQHFDEDKVSQVHPFGLGGSVSLDLAVFPSLIRDRGGGEQGELLAAMFKGEGFADVLQILRICAHAKKNKFGGADDDHFGGGGFLLG